MDDQDAGPEQPDGNLVSRPPTQEDLSALCRELNQRGAKYVVVGGLAISAIDYAEASKHVVVRELDGVPIPFASPELLWRMKAVTHREKDAGDLFFLRQWFAERGGRPPRL